MTKFSHQIKLPVTHDLGRGNADVMTIATSNSATHLNLNLRYDRLSLQPSEAIQLRDTLNRAYPIAPTTFSEIKKGDVVSVSLTVVEVDIRSYGVMFRCDMPPWFNATDAIGYVAPPKPKIEAGQVRESINAGRYLILATPADHDKVVAVRIWGTSAQPFMKDRAEVEAGKVISS